MLVLVLSGLLSFSQYKLTDPIPLDPNVKVGKLSNGLTYYIRRNPKPEKKLELRLAVNAGSVLENDNQRGLAHFMEHMGFNGSRNFPKNELVDFLQKSGVEFGADLNAFTSFDETVYILPVPTEDPQMVEKGFTVLEDWAFNNLFDKNEIEKERGVVLEESRLSKGSFERMSRIYFPKLFNGSKYANRLPIGTDEVLKSFKHETLKSFYKNWYRPNLMAVIVVGDIDPAEAEKKIRAHFEKFKNPAGATPRPSIIPIPQRARPEAMVVTDEEATNTIVQIYNFVKPATRQKTWANYRQALIENLVSTLINQRLSELTQKENPPFLFGQAGYSPFLRGYQAFNSFAVLGEGTIDDAVNALIDETNRARVHGFLQSELDRARASLLTNTEKAYNEKDKSESASIVQQYLNHFLNASPIPGVEHRYQFVKQVLPGITLQEINEAAKKMPTTSNAFTLVMAPAAMKDKLPDSTRLLKTVIAANARKVEAYQEAEVASSLLDKTPAPGKVVATSKNEKLGSTDFTLSNGISIRIKPTTLKNDEIMYDAWRWGGFFHYPLEDKENAKNAATLVRQMGVRDMSPTDLRKFLAGKTLSVTPYINASEEGIEGKSSVRDFETLLQLTHLYMTAPRKDEGLFRSFVSKQKGGLAFMSKDPMTSYFDTLQKIVYSNNPWALEVPRPEDYDRINLDRSMEIYRGIFGNAHGLHFTFVGNIDPEEARPLLEKYLGSLPASPVARTYKDAGIRLLQGQTEVTLKRGKESQSMINLFFEGETEYTRENKLHLAALLEVLNIRIIEKLREDMSGMYGGGLGGTIQKRPYVHYSIQASIPCGPENVEKMTTALIGIIRDAQEKGIDQKDLDKVKETWKKQYHVQMQNNDFWLTGLSNAFINQDNPENILDYEQKVDAITTADLQNAAKKYLTLNNMVKAFLYPESSVVKEEVKTVKGF